jgi:predicted ATPase
MNVSVTQIKIGNLSVDNVRRVVAEALGMDDDDSKVKTLAEAIHKKTEGNPLFVLMFLRSLHDEKLLQYNFGTMKWNWDDDAVNSKIVTNNVASVLVNKMNRLRDEAQRILMVASCLGATFRLSSVMAVMKNISRAEMTSSMRSSSLSVTSELNTSNTDRDDSDSGSTFASSVDEFEEEGLCEVDNQNCRFVHDQIQSVAFELISPELEGFC